MTQLPNRLPTVSFNSAEPTQPLVILLFDDGLRVTPKKIGGRLLGFGCLCLSFS